MCCQNFIQMEITTKWVLLLSMAATLLSILIIFTSWAYVGPCDWIGRLNFDPPPVISYPNEIPDQADNDTISSFVVIGDTQRTSFWECVIGREVNDNETKSLIKEISVANAQFLVFLGDMVFDGGNEKHWQYFDRTMMPLRETKMPILPVLGNHEYWGNRAAARSYVQERFQNMRNTTWYSKRNGPLGMIFMNSNHDEMSNSMWANQIDWLKLMILEWDSKNDIKGIILFAHHPPFTNSVVVSSDTKVRNDIVRIFCETQKALLMVTGHAHGYERFENMDDALNCSINYNSNDTHIKISNIIHRKQAVQFIVSGGGGGPRPSELRSVYLDSFKGPSPRPFNYLIIESADNGIKISIHGLKKGQTRTHKLEELKLEFKI